MPSLRTWHGKICPPRTGAPRPRGRKLWLAAALLLAGCVHPEVVRIVDGQALAGRYVSVEAYAAFVRGVEAELRGDDEAALEAFVEAAEHDDESVEIWSRIGTLRCRLGQAEAAGEAFARASEIDRSYEPLWRAQAGCAAARGRFDEAAAAARMAARLAPEREQTVLLAARSMERAGQTKRAGRWYRAAAVRWPQSVRAWEAMAAFAERTGDERALRWARRRLADLARRRGLRVPATDGPVRLRRAARTWAGVDEALRRGELGEARRRLRSARLNARWLAARAIALGKPQLAVAQAEHLLAADPADTDSRLAMAVGADMLGDYERVLALATLPPDALPPSAVGRLLLAELLQRHVSADAARAWLGGEDFAAADGSAADTDLRRRLRQRLEPTATPPRPLPDSAGP